MWSMDMSLSYGVGCRFGIVERPTVGLATGTSRERICNDSKRGGPVAVQDLVRKVVVRQLLLLLLLPASMAAFADGPVVRLGPAVRSSAPAVSGPSADDVFIYPAGCYDKAGRPVNPDPGNPSRSASAACQPPSGGVVQGNRTAPAAGGPSVDRGSINPPPLPVPVPDIGVMR